MQDHENVAGQIAKMVTTISQQQTPAAQLRTLNESGLFADLLKADAAQVNRAKFREVCGLTPYITKVRLNNELQTLEEWIELGKYDFVNPTFIDKGSPYFARNPFEGETIEVHLVRFGKTVSTAEVETRILDHGGFPIPYLTLLMIGAQFPELQRKAHIGCTRPLSVTTHFLYPCLFGYAGQRRLGIHGDDVWDEHFQFAYTLTRS